MTVKECTEKRDARKKLLFCQFKPIAFLPFSLTSPPSLLSKFSILVTGPEDPRTRNMGRGDVKYWTRAREMRGLGMLSNRTREPEIRDAETRDEGLEDVE